MTTSKEAFHALFEQHGPRNLFMIQAVCSEATKLFHATPLEILELLAKSSPEELAKATDVAKALHLIGILVLRRIDEGLAEGTKQVESTKVDLTAAPQLYEALQLKNAEVETQAVLARTMGGPGDPRTLH